MILIYTKVSVLCASYLVLVMGLLNNFPIPGYLTWIKTYSHVMLSNPTHVSTIPYYVAIINDIFPNWLLKKKQQTQTRWRLKTSLSWTACLGKQQTRLNKIPLVHFEPATLTRLDIIFFYGQVIHTPHRKYIYVMHSFLQL